MRVLLGFCCILIIICSFLGVLVIDVETRAARWQARVDLVQEMQGLNQDILKSQRYSNKLLEAVRMLASENGILCERERAVTGVVMSLEEENLRLSLSLDEAIQRLKEDDVRINELLDANERLQYQLETLERAFDKLTQETPDV